MGLGLAGAAIFSQFKGGAAILLSPTFEFIVSFILIAYIAVKVAEKMQCAPMYMLAALIGIAINYRGGIT